MDQFHIKSEFSFRKCFGQVPRIIAAAKSIGARAVALTDNNTFGHISFYKAAKAAELVPILGIELKVNKDGDGGDARSCTFYARTSEGLSELYGWSTLAARRGGRLTYDDVWQMSDGIIKGIGTALNDDLIGGLCGVVLIEVNPVSKLARERALAASKQHKLPILPVSDVSYPLCSDKAIANLMGVATKTTPQWMLTRTEAEYFMPEIPKSAYKTHDYLRELCNGVQLLRAENIHHPMDLEAACRRNLKKVGEWTQHYEDRLKMELATIDSKHFNDYFAMLSEMCRYAKKHMLVGPARGSAAGSLVCYLLDITEIDPIVHDLMFERFIDETRFDFPDVDLDFPDNKREIVFDYLRKRYGKDNVAHIGTISRLKAKSAIGEVAKRLNIPPWETDAIKAAMIERSGGDSRAAMCLQDTFDSIQVGKEFITKYPAMKNAAQLEDHAWHSGVHAAGALVCNNPVQTYCTIDDQGTAQLDKKDAEAINLMKVDLLGLRTLSLIESTGIDVRNVPLDDPEAFKILNDQRFTGIFQFEGSALQSLTKQMGVREFEDIVAITSLARPGPLHSGGATIFISRKRGDEAVEKIHPIFDRICSKTQGMVLYQEQVMQLLREVGQMEWADVQILRRAMSKSLGLEFFEKFYLRFEDGALKRGLNHEDVRKMWDLMIHFGSYGFNRSHAVAYAIISYWCAWLKAHHPVQFAYAALKHAKDEDQAIRLLREIINEGQIEYVPFDAEHSDVSWSIYNGKILGGLIGIKGVGEKTAKAIVAARANGTLTARQRAILAKPELMFDDLYPAQRLFGHIYKDPEAHNINGPITMLKDITSESSGSKVVIVKMLAKDIRDLNEALSLARRNGKIMHKDNLFINMDLEDDTDKIVGTIGRFDYKKLGTEILDAPVGSWWVFRGDVRKGFRKLYIKKMRRLNEARTESVAEHARKPQAAK